MSLKDFVILEKLGKGSFATVYKARRLTDQKIYAIKQIDMTRMDQKSKNNALNEIRFLASFQSPNIITYHEAFFEQNLNVLCIVMEFAQGGDLSQAIKNKQNEGQKFLQIEIWKILTSLAHGLAYLHSKSILHRDIKPENIFISNGIYKIGDLNVSRVKDQAMKQTQTGTPFYASPEVWNNSPYDEKCDIWSLGCVLYHLATLRPPFSSTSMQKLFNEVTTAKTKPLPHQFSDELSLMVLTCLQKKPENRPKVEQILSNWTVKMYQNLCYTSEQLEKQKQKCFPLLKTISMPKNKSLWQSQLPRPNYDGSASQQQDQDKRHQQSTDIPSFHCQDYAQSKDQQARIQPNRVKQQKQRLVEINDDKANKQNCQKQKKCREQMNGIQYDSKPKTSIHQECSKYSEKTSFAVKQNVQQQLKGQQPKCLPKSSSNAKNKENDSNRKLKHRSSPRTELSAQKVIHTNSQKQIKDFQCGNEKVKLVQKNLLLSKMMIPNKKQSILQELVRNQQKKSTNFIQSASKELNVIVDRRKIFKQVQSLVPL